MIDYRSLLVRYMAEVLDCEGVSFIDSAPWLRGLYTLEERAELEKIEKEASAKMNGLWDTPADGTIPINRIAKEHASTFPISLHQIESPDFPPARPDSAE